MNNRPPRPHPPGNNGHAKRHQLYRLPDVLTADLIYIVESKEAAAAARAVGLTEVCTPGSNGHAGPTWASLAGRKTVIIPSHDETGEAFTATAIKKALAAGAAECRVVTMPEICAGRSLPDEYDIEAALAECTDSDDRMGLRQAVEQAADEGERITLDTEPVARSIPTATSDGDGQDGRDTDEEERITPPDEVSTERLRLTDVGNGRRMARRHRNEIRHCWPWNKWLSWDRHRWKLDDTGAIAARAKTTVRSIYLEAAGASDDSERARIAKWAHRSEQRTALAAMVDLARSEPGISILPPALDSDPWLLNCMNGTLDLRTGTLRKHSPRDFITKLCPTVYDPEATCPTWIATLVRIFAGDLDLVQFVKRLTGYCITGSTANHILPVLWGVGSNGKSTVIGAIMDMLGPDYAMKAPRNMLMARHGEHHPTEFCDLHGKRFVAAVETAEGQRLDEALVKELTGGDPIRARRMREDHWQFNPTHKLILATNHRPEIRDTTHSTWRRVKLLPFSVVIPDAEQDHSLPQKLQAERAGILAWAVEGCLEWQRDGLGEPSAVTTATSEYRSEQDLIGAFLDECCRTGRNERERAATLYKLYRAWSEQHGERAVNQTRFGKALSERGFDREKAGVYWYRGLSLESDLDG